MSEGPLSYANDPRTTCKYGAKCYQKNPEHHRSYKHPPIDDLKKFNKNKRGKARNSPYARNKNTFTKGTEVLASTTQATSSDGKKPEDDISVTTTTDQKKEDTYKDLPLVTLTEDSQLYDKSEDNKLYSELFLVEMPPDFFQFYKCLSEEKSVEKTLANVNLQLIGPYDLLLGKLPILDDKELYLVHWRFFFDPPEFQVNCLQSLYSIIVIEK